MLSLPDVRLKAAEALGPKAADHLWTAGHRLSQAEAIDLAMSSPPLASLGEDPGV
jgi:hypothetical protein